MIKKDLNYIYNLDYLICIPQEYFHLIQGFAATFENVVLIKNTYDDITFFKTFLKKNNIKRLIFINYNIYAEVKGDIPKEIIVDFIFPESLSGLSDINNLNNFNQIITAYQNGKITQINLLDENLYNVLKNKKYKVNLIKLRSSLKIKRSRKENIVGLLNSQMDPKDSFYNELTALSLIDYKVKILNPNKVTKDFCKKFNIKWQKVKTYEELISNNLINLDINFTTANILPFLDSMNNGVPCLLGNTPLLDKYPKLKEYLVLNSDDDCNEIAFKIKKAVENKEKILDLYKDFKSDYEQSVKQLKYKLIKKEEKVVKDNYKYLLSVIIPIYNVEKYIEKTLQSILNALIDDMEIILINDGSTDNSGNIVKAFAKKYPNIRFISQENHGLGYVRNVGLKEAQGKYIASIDSDDTINCNFFKEAVPYLKQDIDIVIYDWLSVVPGKETFPTPALDKMLNIENNYKSILYATIMPSACNKIIKKSIYKELDLKFAELKYEDLSANPLVLLQAKKIKYINKPYYEYMIRPNSIMRNSAKNIDYDMIKVINILENSLKNHEDLKAKINIQEFKNYVFWWRIEELIINKIYDLEIHEIKDYVKFMNDNIYSTLKDIYENNDFVNQVISKFDEETRTYITKRNEAILNNKLDKFIIENRKNHKIITAAMILYNIDNRGV